MSKRKNSVTREPDLEITRDFLVKKKVEKRTRSEKISDDVFEKASLIAKVLAPSYTINKYEAISGAINWLYETFQQEGKLEQ